MTIYYVVIKTIHKNGKSTVRSSFSKPGTGYREKMDFSFPSYQAILPKIPPRLENLIRFMIIIILKKCKHLTKYRFNVKDVCKKFGFNACIV